MADKRRALPRWHLMILVTAVAVPLIHAVSFTPGFNAAQPNLSEDPLLRIIMVMLAVLVCTWTWAARFR